MANTQTIGADRAFGLDDLNTWIAQHDQLLGPIVDIADGGTATAGVFDLSKPRVKAKFARVSQMVGGVCVLGAGETKICEGEAYIATVLLPVCVSRPS